MTISLPTESPSIRGLSSDNIGIASVRVTYTDAVTGAVSRRVFAACTGCGATSRSAQWTDAPGLGLGVYNVQAEAVDEVGNSSKSATVTFVVL